MWHLWMWNLVTNQVWLNEDQFFWIVMLVLDAPHLLDDEEN